MKTKKSKHHKANSQPRSPQERQLLLDQLYASELTQAEFSRQQGLNPKTLNRWIRESKQQSNSGFHEPVEVSIATQQPLSILLPNNIKVTMPVPSNSVACAQLVKELLKC